MNFNDTIAGWIMLLVVLVFLFNGEPDVWDALHAKAMSLHPNAAQQEAPKPPQKKGLAF